MATLSRDVFSSHIRTIGYDDETGELTVTFDNGKTAAYAGVPGPVAQSVMNAPSIGQALHNSVRGQYDFRYVRLR